MKRRDLFGKGAMLVAGAILVACQAGDSSEVAEDNEASAGSHSHSLALENLRRDERAGVILPFMQVEAGEDLEAGQFVITTSSPESEDGRPVAWVFPQD